MKLSAALNILLDLRFAIHTAFTPTFYAVLGSPSLLLRPHALSRMFMAKLWIGGFGNGVDANGRSVKQHLITPNAYGVVLDIGAGHGHTANYLDKSRVTKYIALEPNTEMHAELRLVANVAGFTESQGTLLILSCGAEDIGSIVSSTRKQSIDTLVSILTLCSIPSPEDTLKAIISSVLKSGGQLLFYEHVLSPRSDVACPTDLWLERMAYEDGGSVWGQKSVWDKEGEPEEHLFYHRAGRMVKHLF